VERGRAVLPIPTGKSKGVAVAEMRSAIAGRSSARQGQGRTRRHLFPFQLD
jgi:hypothetical protein